MCCRIIVFMLVAFAVLCLFSCDNRGNDKPEMDFSSLKDTLYQHPDYDHCDFEIQLTGNTSYISERQINFEYDTEKGTIIGAGSSLLAYTDENGYLKAEYVVSDSVFGWVQLTAKMEVFPSVEQTISIYVLDMPNIFLSAQPDTVSVNSSTTITIALESSTDNISGQNIDLEIMAGEGTLSLDSVLTNSDGLATFVYQSGSQPGDTQIGAQFSRFPEVSEDIVIRVTE
ncbi:MAG: hypothetical protein PHR06_01890 [Candidatus Cloacimonetes bacterium]|nr:hypothetical protein [Candidatus Cloacimonadota bacterium]